MCFCSGKIECTLFGEYAESLKRSMESAGAGMLVVVMQFLKQKIFRGEWLCFFFVSSLFLFFTLF